MKQSIKAPAAEEDIEDIMEKKCVYAQNRLYEDIRNMRVCVAEAGKDYKYCFQQPAVVEQFKEKIDSIEYELRSLDKVFDIFNDLDGAPRRKINSLQSDLIFYQKQKEDVVSIFLKVKEIVEARLQHLSNILFEVEKCEWNIYVPN